MIQNASPTGWNATYKPWRVEPVIGWDERGCPLITDPASGMKVLAHDLQDHEFRGLERAEAPIVGVLPGGGWTIHWADGTSDPVIGFTVQADGATRPLLAEPNGHAAPYYPASTDGAARLQPPRTTS